MRDTQKSHHKRLNDLESQIELLKGLHSPAGDDGSTGLLDALQDMQNKLRSEFDDKLLSVQDVLKRLMALEEESREKDTDLQDQIDNLNKLFDKHDQ